MVISHLTIVAAEAVPAGKPALIALVGLFVLAALGSLLRIRKVNRN